MKDGRGGRRAAIECKGGATDAAVACGPQATIYFFPSKAARVRGVRRCCISGVHSPMHPVQCAVDCKIHPSIYRTSKGRSIPPIQPFSPLLASHMPAVN
jgi:hypothetical protein